MDINVALMQRTKAMAADDLARARARVAVDCCDRLQLAIRLLTEKAPAECTGLQSETARARDKLQSLVAVELALVAEQQSALAAVEKHWTDEQARVLALQAALSQRDSVLARFREQRQQTKQAAKRYALAEVELKHAEPADKARLTQQVQDLQEAKRQGEIAEKAALHSVRQLSLLLPEVLLEEDLGSVHPLADTAASAFQKQRSLASDFADVKERKDRESGAHAIFDAIDNETGQRVVLKEFATSADIMLLRRQVSSEAGCRPHSLLI
jgi:chromosome segregation ATPase